ncbi:hypothetical protein DF032_08165 [Burkholderia seminalis]|nr:hypothetical protein DF032_08165 [Burkholderia seminalis]
MARESDIVECSAQDRRDVLKQDGDSVLSLRAWQTRMIDFQSMRSVTTVFAFRFEYPIYQ